MWPFRIRSGAIGEAEAFREREIRVAENMAQAEKGRKSAMSDQRIFVQQREAEAVDGENKSKANMATSNAELAVREAEAEQKAEVARREAAVEIQKAQYRAELERLTAQEVVQKEIDKRMIEISAEAEAERIRREARGNADGILMRFLAEAEGTQKLLEAKAAGYAHLVNAAGGDAKSAATLLMIEKMQDLVQLQVEAISRLKIDKITVWDSGSGGNSSTANFVSSLIKSIPPLQDVAEMVGVELPDYLGKMKESPAAPAAPPQPAEGNG